MGFVAFYNLFFLFIVSIVSASPSIIVDSVKGEAIYAHIDDDKLCRISIYQHESSYLAFEVARQYANYLYTIDHGEPFILFYDVASTSTSPYMAILAECQGYSEPSLLNFRVEERSFECNSKTIRFREISNMKDSCVYVTLQYDGSGDYYVIIRAGANNPVDADNIVQEGVYLGRHGKEGVSTIFCNIYEKAEYTIYATVVDDECIHTPTKQVFTTESFSPDMKWSIGSNTVWASNSKNINHGVRYRRYGGVVYPSSYINELPITPAGVLTVPMDVVYAKVEDRTHQDASMSDDTTFHLLNNNVVWRSGELSDGEFTGLLMVFGTGDLYIYCSRQTSGVDIQEVVSKGKNVGFVTDDAVDIAIRGLGEGGYTIYAVLAYKNQFVGPFSRSI